MKNKCKKIISIMLAIVCVLISTITVNAAEVNTETNITFSDIKSTDWFYNNVTEMVKLGIVNGYEDGTFRPQGAVQADEFIKMVLEAMGYEPSPSDSTYWADGYITKAEELKIADKTFINDYRYELTREQTSRIIVNALYKTESHPANTYYEYIKNAIKDYHLIADKYKQDVIDCYALGIMQGDTNQNINPQQTITRAETTAVIMRMINKDKRLPVKFDTNKNEVTLSDGRGEGTNATMTLIAPMYNGKPLTEIIDVTKILKEQIKVSEGGEDLYFSSQNTVCLMGYGSQENLQWVIDIEKSGNVTMNDIAKLANISDFGFDIDTINFTSKYDPYSLHLWKKINLDEYGYTTYDEYFLNMYQEPFEKMFRYLFEDEFDIAWNYFKNALKYNEKQVKSIEKSINSRILTISYANDGMQLRISLKNK